MIDPLSKVGRELKAAEEFFELAKNASSPFVQAYYRRVGERYLSSQGELKSVKTQSDGTDAIRTTQAPHRPPVCRSRSKCCRSPLAPCATTTPAITEAIPPEICCTDALTVLNEPRFVISGIADISACDGIMREKMPTNINTVTCDQ
jgi:hypothetical protein